MPSPTNSENVCGVILHREDSALSQVATEQPLDNANSYGQTLKHIEELEAYGLKSRAEASVALAENAIRTAFARTAEISSIDPKKAYELDERLRTIVGDRITDINAGDNVTQNENLPDQAILNELKLCLRILNHPDNYILPTIDTARRRAREIWAAHPEVVQHLIFESDE